VSRTKLERFPDEIGGLASLKALSFNDAPVVELPRTMTKLANLESIEARTPTLTKLPEWLAELPKLNEIYVNKKQLESGEAERLRKARKGLEVREV
jgi:Leucine-rich repeat (LRR) protein